QVRVGNERSAQRRPHIASASRDGFVDLRLERGSDLSLRFAGTRRCIHVWTSPFCAFWVIRTKREQRVNGGPSWAFIWPRADHSTDRRRKRRSYDGGWRMTCRAPPFSGAWARYTLGTLASVLVLQFGELRSRREHPLTAVHAKKARKAFSHHKYLACDFWG